MAEVKFNPAGLSENKHSGKFLICCFEFSSLFVDFLSLENKLPAEHPFYHLSEQVFFLQHLADQYTLHMDLKEQLYVGMMVLSSKKLSLY